MQNMLSPENVTFILTNHTSFECFYSLQYPLATKNKPGVPKDKAQWKMIKENTETKFFIKITK